MPDETAERARILAQRKGVHRLWAGYFLAAAMLSCAVVVFIPAGPRWLSWPAAALLLTPMVAFHFLVTRWYSSDLEAREGSRRGWVYAAIAAASLTGACALNPWALLGSFFVIPQIGIALPYLLGMVVTVAMNLAITLVSIVQHGFSSPDARQMALACLAAVTFSVIFSKPIDTIAQTNIDNQRLLAELSAQRAELTRLSQAQGAARERERFAREMHDTVAQGLASILTLGRAARDEIDDEPASARRHLDLITEVAAQSLQESRTMIAALGPPQLASDTLPQAVARTARRCAEEAGLDAEVSTAPLPEMPQAVQVAVLRICQEALANVRRHARASHIRVRLEPLAEGLRLTVTDDGAGFDPALLDPGRTDQGGYGLWDMRGRAQEIGGTLQLTSAPGQGCTVRLDLPDPGRTGPEDTASPRPAPGERHP